MPLPPARRSPTAACRRQSRHPDDTSGQPAQSRTKAVAPTAAQKMGDTGWPAQTNQAPRPCGTKDPANSMATAYRILSNAPRRTPGTPRRSKGRRRWRPPHDVDAERAAEVRCGWRRQPQRGAAPSDAIAQDQLRPDRRGQTVIRPRCVHRPMSMGRRMRRRTVSARCRQLQGQVRRSIDGPGTRPTLLPPSRLYGNSASPFRRSQIAVISPFVQASRSLNFWILPDPVSGNASTTNQCFGVLCGASEARM